MRPFPKQIAAITQHAMQPEQTTWPKTSAILWGLGRKFGMAGWYWVWVWVVPPQKLLEPKILCHICVRRRNSRKMPKK